MCTDNEELPLLRLHAGTKILKARLPSAGTSQDQKKRQQLTLIGRSWAADSTAFCVPELNVGFDAGYVVSEKRMAHYLISHTHSDHVHMLTHLKSRSKPPQFVLPKESIPFCEGFLNAAQMMSSHLMEEEYKQVEWQKTHDYVGVSAGDSFMLDKKRGLFVDVIHCDHGVPCVGFRLALIKEKLKAEYSDLPGREIGKLRKSGVEVVEPVRIPLLTFLGDTHASIFENEETIGDSPVIIVECSFLDPNERDRARATNHVHWLDLEPHIRSHPDVIFVLIHFSHRYSAKYVREFFSKRKDENDDSIPSNILPWVSPESSDDLPECYIHS